jgi:hypothetical protein
VLTLKPSGYVFKQDEPGSGISSDRFAEDADKGVKDGLSTCVSESFSSSSDGKRLAGKCDEPQGDLRHVFCQEALDVSKDGNPGMVETQNVLPFLIPLDEELAFESR